MIKDEIDVAVNKVMNSMIPLLDDIPDGQLGGPGIEVLAPVWNRHSIRDLTHFRSFLVKDAARYSERIEPSYLIISPNILRVWEDLRLHRIITRYMATRIVSKPEDLKVLDTMIKELVP